MSTQAQWQALIAEKLVGLGVPKPHAKQRAREGITKQAVANLNAMAKVGAEKVLVDAAVAKLALKQ